MPLTDEQRLDRLLDAIADPIQTSTFQGRSTTKRPLAEIERATEIIAGRIAAADTSRRAVRSIRVSMDDERGTSGDAL